LKIIYIEPGTSIAQAMSNAYFALRDEPITLCANGCRIIMMKDEYEELKPIEVPSPLIINAEPNQEYAKTLDGKKRTGKEAEK